MKSVIIKDGNGNILIKIIHRKNGEYELIQIGNVALDIDVRDEKGCKVIFNNRLVFVHKIPKEDRK